MVDYNEGSDDAVNEEDTSTSNVAENEVMQSTIKDSKAYKDVQDRSKDYLVL